MHRAWLHDPTSVHISWQSYFANLSSGLPSQHSFQMPPSHSIAPRAAPGTIVPDAMGGQVFEYLKVQLLVRAYQVRGHHLAKLDPLGIADEEHVRQFATELDITRYGFSEKDLDRSFKLGPGILPHFIPKGITELSLRQIVQELQHIYCGPVGVEYTHIPNKEECDWIRERVEVPDRVKFTVDEKRVILDRLTWASSFEEFLKSKWASEKRFGLEGCEALIPGMKALIDHAVELGVDTITLGMPHRGRLNVLSNVVRKPNESIFCDFGGGLEPSKEGSGDVKYHLGMNFDRPTPSGKRVHLSLVANPSHLEAVNPVVTGKTRATQFYQNDEDRSRAMAVLLHGDAAFAAQGVVYETLGMADLPNYTIGGTVHLVVNNQIGFTTDPRFARSTPYCTDIAKAINAPVIHVNADDVEAVTWACQLAAEWRQTFKRDIVVDLVCYRKYGHNEIDQPMFTQPRMYEKINKMTSVLEKYSTQLKQEGSLTEQDIVDIKQRVWGLLEESYQKSKDYKPTSREWMSSAWNGFKSPRELAETVLPSYPSGAPRGVLEVVGHALTFVPGDFHMHPVVAKIMEAKKKTIQEQAGIDWATAEAFAFGSLLMEGKHVRLSGQDVERGTFSHRHAVLHDQKNERQYIPLSNISPQQAAFTVCNSSLSEFGTLGFELGYSLVDPNALVMWEAQFGDFANNAQCIIDQFIASGERKWLQRTGLVLSLPHGYDGQGPEHSSARVERFLQLCDDHPYTFPDKAKMQRQHQDCNMQVVYPTTPANYFHVLRRQMHRDFRKPLVCIFSKSLLRHPMARSSLAEMTKETRFQRYIPDTNEGLVSSNKVRKHILCSGQVYYALLKARQARNIEDVAISRIEQYSPFPYDLLQEHVDAYPNAQVMWVQEEPLNMGAWQYVGCRIQSTLHETQHHKHSTVQYVARDSTGSVATGNKKQHIQEEEGIIGAAFA